MDGVVKPWEFVESRMYIARLVRITVSTILLSGPVVYAAPARAQEPPGAVLNVTAQWPGTRPWQIEISDDGRFIVYQTNRGDGWKLYLHELGQSESREIIGLGDTPYFGRVSPDDRWLLFGKKARIWKAPFAGGEPVLVYAGSNWFSWETDTTFLVSKGAAGIWRVQADGSMREEQVAAVDRAAGATDYGRPSPLPGAAGVAVSVGFGTGTDQRRIGIVTIPSGRLTVLDEYGINPRYAASGHILYTQANTLKAIPFDLERLEATGPSATVVEGVHVYSNQSAQFDISTTGVLVYVPGPSELDRIGARSLFWVDREGNETPLDARAEALFEAARLSPDQRFAAVSATGGLALFDREASTWSVLDLPSTASSSGPPIWSRDGQYVFYSTTILRDGRVRSVFGRQAVRQGASWEELWSGDRSFLAQAISADGTLAFGVTPDPMTGDWRLMSLDLGAPTSLVPLLAGDAFRGAPAPSPDGRWLAYVERTRGIDQVYVRPIAAGPALLVSEGGSAEAAEPVWGRDSNELFYRDAAHIVAVQLELDPEPRVRTRTPLFPASVYYRLVDTYAPTYDYDRATDRFLVARSTTPLAGAESIRVIENGFELLDRLAPGRR